MKTINRDEVILLIVKCRLMFCEKSELVKFLDDYHIDYDSTKVAESLFEALSESYQGVSNGFLSEIYECLTGDELVVTGDSKRLFSCPCCQYQTLTEVHDPKQGTGYDICDYCKWEDDGSRDAAVYSSVNKGSMEEYRKRIVQNPDYYYREKWMK